MESNCLSKDKAEYAKINFRGLEVPDYPRIVNHGVDSFSRSADLIDKLNPQYREWDKVKVLIEDNSYLEFIGSIGKALPEAITGYFNDFEQDLQFRREFSGKLAELEAANLKHVDDLRFHSLTMYCLVRSLKPQLMVETGVAYGKSSTMALLAMEHNKSGKLISIDLPNPQGKVLADGAQTSTGQREVGWLVPDFLKPKWDLRLGDARQLLPAVLARASQAPDIFLHDSLHTYEHTKFELKTVLRHMKSGLIICDNIEMGSGRAFHEILEERKITAYAYRNLAGCFI